MRETQVQFLGREDPLQKGWATHSRILGLPWWLSWYRIRLQCGGPGLGPWVGQIPREGNGYLLQDSALEKSMDCTVYGVVKSRTRPSE